jgi:hypothetical protein
LTEQHRQFAEHRARLRHLGDLHPVLGDLDRTCLQDQQPAGGRAGGEHGLASLVGGEGESGEPRLEGGGIQNQRHVRSFPSSTVRKDRCSKRLGQ